MEKGGTPVAKDELTVAKINAAIKILEWSKDSIEPGIGGTPNQLHVALADAFRIVYSIVSDSVHVTSSNGSSSEEIPEGAIP
jgi:hypothetical protein